ncbi:nuclear transport factor 2 family protein [Sphingomonas sp. MMS24-J13]|uniref:nuclear transport factor 2 family protein n=1 Tax=Sphingomonas sp. MMS24-J13 TaxID=3238686 RepID=UPI003850017A
MSRFAAAAFAAIMMAGAAQAADLSPIDIVTRHNAAVAKSDVDAMMADYADGAIVLEAGKTIQGKPAIRALFAGMFPKPAPGAAPTGAAAMTVTRKWAEGNVGFYTWEMGAVHGTDEFVVRNGKIEVQSVFIGGGPAK